LTLIERDLQPYWLRGVNAVDNCKVRRLANSMMQHGWTGRRLLVEQSEGGHFAWTGTHRIVAARLAALPAIPCTILTQEEADAAFKPVYGDRHGYSCWRQKLTGAEGALDKHRLQGLTRAGLTEAAAMLRQEMEAPAG
jgi:hypothetical protein